MSGLRRTVVRAVLLVAGMQLLGLAIIAWFHVVWARNETYLLWLDSLNREGLLEACDADPDWHIPLGAVGGLWPLDDAGRPRHASGPDLQAPLARPGTLLPVEAPEVAPFIASITVDRPGCRHFLVVVPHRFYLDSAAAPSWTIARLLVAAVSIVALYALILSPLVRRIRRMAAATRRVVDTDFQGAVDGEADDELGDLADAFNHVTAEVRDRIATLRHRDERLRDALADVAHDVRTPLTSIMLTLDEVRGHLPARQIARLEADLGHVEAMLANLDALIRLEGTALPLARASVDLGQLVERVVLRLERLAAERAVALAYAEPDEPILLTGDPVAIEQALSNLVKNALDHATANVAVVSFTGDDAIVEVRDDGPGAASTELPRLSERRYRGAGREGRDGRGLGLAIAQEVAVRHGGALQLENADEGGLVARLRLPFG